MNPIQKIDKEAIMEEQELIKLSWGDKWVSLALLNGEDILKVAVIIESMLTDLGIEYKKDESDSEDN